MSQAGQGKGAPALAVVVQQVPAAAVQALVAVPVLVAVLAGPAAAQAVRAQADPVAVVQALAAVQALVAVPAVALVVRAPVAVPAVALVVRAPAAVLVEPEAVPNAPSQ